MRKLRLLRLVPSVDVERAALREMLCDGNIMKAGKELDQVQTTFDQLYNQNHVLMEHNKELMSDVESFNRTCKIIIAGALVGVVVGLIVAVLEWWLK